MCKNALSVRQATSEIASGNLDLSQRTEEQASSLEETASSMEELTSAVRQNTDNSVSASQLALTASDITAKGGIAMKEVVTTMSAISESSKRSQTSLMSLMALPSKQISWHSMRPLKQRALVSKAGDLRS